MPGGPPSRGPPHWGLGLAVGGMYGHARGQTRSWQLAGAVENWRKLGRVAGGWPGGSWKSSLPVFPTKGLLSPASGCASSSVNSAVFCSPPGTGTVSAALKPPSPGAAREALQGTATAGHLGRRPQGEQGTETRWCPLHGGGGRPDQPWGLLESGSWGWGGGAEPRPSRPDPAAPRAEPGLVHTGWVSREGQQGLGLPPGGSPSTQAGEAAPGCSAR